jgi:hypothetical protein
MKGFITQLITIAALLAWAAARRKASTGGWKGRRRTRPLPGGGGDSSGRPMQPPAAAQRPRGEDVVWGTRPLRHPPRVRAGGQVVRARASEASMPSARRAAKKRGAAPQQERAEWEGVLGSSAAGQVTTARRWGDPWQRLGVGRGRSARRAGLRRAILLSEVLGAPRAMRGPAGRRAGDR